MHISRQPYTLKPSVIWENNMRLRKIKNATEKLMQYTDVVCFTPQDNKGKWKSVFGNENPIYLEIGMGKGKFLTENAERHPDINYIGLEMSESIVLKAARKIREQNLRNLILLNINAATLPDVFADGEISLIYLNFSDPWPKSRHAKRRLTSDAFLVIYQRILAKQGIIEMRTDNRSLFEYSLLKFNEYRFRFLEVNLNLHETENPELITTEYEDRFSSVGNIIYYIKVEIWISEKE